MNIIQEFFLTVKDAIRCGTGANQGGYWSQSESQLFNKLMLTQDLVHKALCGNYQKNSSLRQLLRLTKKAPKADYRYNINLK